MNIPVTYGSSWWAKYRIRAASVTYTAATAIQDPSNQCTGPGIKPRPPQQPKLLQTDS